MNNCCQLLQLKAQAKNAGRRLTSLSDIFDVLNIGMSISYNLG